MLMVWYYIISLSVFMVSLILILGSSSPILLWMFLELNLLFMMFMIFEKKMSIKAMLCYFIFQIFGSLIFLYGFLIKSMLFMTVLGLMVKIGIFPFHIWQPFVFMNMSWKVCSLLAGPQKVTLMFIYLWLSYNWNSVFLMNLIITVMIGNFCLSFFTDLKKAFAYLSISSSAWLLLSSWYMEQMMWYMFFYNMQLVFLFFMFLVMEISNVYSKKLMDFSVIIFIISYMGIPPFIGFFLKTQVLIFFNSVTENFIFTFFLTTSMIPSIFFMFFYVMKFLLVSKDSLLIRGEVIFFISLMCVLLFMPFFFVSPYLFNMKSMSIFQMESSIFEKDKKKSQN